MAFKITGKKLDERDRLLQEVNEAKSKLEDAVTTYNAAVEDARSSINDFITAFNTALGNAKDFIEGVRDDAQTEFDEKSEKWQESDRGSQVQSWIDEMEGHADTLDTELSVDFPSELSIEYPDYEDALNGHSDASDC